MSRHISPGSPRKGGAHTEAMVAISAANDAVLVSVTGLVDERFAGFGNLGTAKAVVINVAGMTRMTSFGVRQWLKSMDALPKTLSAIYLLGCPTFFVDQLNMVLNFGGAAKILTVVAPFVCSGCGVEAGETIDVLAERANLAKGGLPEPVCSRCGAKLEFDETPESYFAFVNNYAASSLQPEAAKLLAAHGLYTSAEVAIEKPPRIIKLVHGSVTYFRIIGTIGSMFRARPLLVGAEGEVVIDLAEVERFDSSGQNEWRRLIKSLSTQVPSVTLVDVADVASTVETLALGKNISVASVLVPYGCIECGRASHESLLLSGASWPLQFGAHVCPRCGGTTCSKISSEPLGVLQKASTNIPPASAKMISQRDEILSRALTDANVAQAGESATASVAADDTILGKYKIVRRLSAGGMAEVFLAKQVGIGGFEKIVALKRIQRKLLESRHQAIELFLNEAKIAGRLTHPNIVQVLDVGEVHGALYLAMEYVHGKDLRAVIRRVQQTGGGMPLGEACYVVREVAQALHHAYWSNDINGQRLSVVHRDVSPHNIILGYEGTVKLLDFGVAMSAVTEHAQAMIVGKWLYMSPEATTSQQIDHRSDLFSLGVVLYFLCSGAMPFTAPEPKEIVKKIRAGQFRPLQAIAPHVPERLALLVSRMMSPNPDDRPQRGLEVVAELTEIGRHYGLESSGPNIAQFLVQLFPDEGGGLADAVSGVQEIVRSVSEGSLTQKEATRLGSYSSALSRSPMSFTPTPSSSMRAPVNYSETFERAAPEMSQSVSLKPGPVKPAPFKPAPLKPVAREPIPLKPASREPASHDEAPRPHLIIPPRPLPSTAPRAAASPLGDLAKVAGLIVVFLIAAVVAYLVFSG